MARSVSVLNAAGEDLAPVIGSGHLERALREAETDLHVVAVDPPKLGELAFVLDEHSDVDVLILSAAGLLVDVPGRIDMQALREAAAAPRSLRLRCATTTAPTHFWVRRSSRSSWTTACSRIAR